MPLLSKLFFVVFVLMSGGAQAATYYVRNGGSDSADGRSHATAWATVAKVNSFSFSAGDSVLFQEGGVWRREALVVDWGGTSSQHAVVGAYYLDNGTPRRGFVSKRPTIDGEDRVPSASIYNGLVQVTANRVRLENLAIVNSEGRGINIAEVDYAEIVGVVVQNTYNCGISIIKGDDALIENSHVIDTDRQRPESGSDWCAAIAMIGAARPTVRGNIVEKVFGEGINANHNSVDAVIEDNFVFGARAVGIYSDASPRTTIRRNMVVGTSDSRFWRGGSTVGGGIVLNNENYHYSAHGGSLSSSVQSRGARVYGNLVAYTSQGIGLWGQLDGSTFDNTLIYNNTLVDNDTQFLTNNRSMPSSAFLNNVLVSLSSGTKDVSGTASGLTVRHSYFGNGDPGGIYSHSSNRYKGVQLARMSGWRAIRDANQVAWSDFVPVGGSATIGGGDGGPLASGAGKDAFGLDYKSQAHNAPPDMGAIRFGTASPKVPKVPTLVEVTTSP